MIENRKIGEFRTCGLFVGSPGKTDGGGKFIFMTYGLPGGTQEPSALAVVRNSENAITKIGSTIVKSDPNR